MIKRQQGTALLNIGTKILNEMNKNRFLIQNAFVKNSFSMNSFHTYPFLTNITTEQRKSQNLTDPKLRELFDSVLNGKIAESQVFLNLYDQLEPVSLEFMIGKWKGKELRTNHPMDDLLAYSGWYGKLFQDPENVHPLLFYKSNGRDLYAVNPDRVVPAMDIPIPKTEFIKKVMLWVKPLTSTRNSKARLRLTEFRGKVSATMVYDNQPINDVFRRIDENTVIGAMDSKGFKNVSFFVLQRDDHNNVKIDIQ